MVYMSGDSVFYSYSADNGAHWVPYEFVAEGQFPCVTCVSETPLQPCRVWVSYTTATQIVCQARRGPCDWQVFTARDASDDLSTGLGPPSMSPGYHLTMPGPFRGVYLAYKVAYTTGSSIEYRAVDLDRGVVDQFVVDDVSATIKRDPSIATTPGDVVSVVWQRDDGGEQRICYRHCYYGTWGYTIRVSYEPIHPYAEPAWTPCVDAYGDSAYVVWRGRSEAGTPDGDVWQRTVHIEQVPWMPNDPWDVSATTQVLSEYPQNSTNSAVAYQEEWESWDLFGFVMGRHRDLWTDPANSKYPDITAELYVPPEPAGVGLDMVWTSEEQPGGPYEVRFAHQDFRPEDAQARNWYYDCGVGDSVPSRFCLARDGRAKWRDYKVDYARDGLRYHLPFLSPAYAYKVRAVLFQASQDTWVNDFSLKGRRVARVAYRPLQPETAWVTIPRDLYLNDCAVTLDISRVAGKYATVADLRLYQCSPYRQGHGDGQQAGSVTVPAETSPLSVVGASLSRRSITLSFQADAATKTSLRIYDARGAFVKELVSGPALLGRHVVRWDGTDFDGKCVPAGAYFCRLDNERTISVRKVVLTQ
ncbi:hypothetical protein FJY71_03880 [candidate division WOR-3 bacterium]|nr:hypothetical protein [candidate division WOR-3 bacterium]